MDQTLYDPSAMPTVLLIEDDPGLSRLVGEVLRGDPFRVAQIVGNLVNNALKYGLAGSRVGVFLAVVGAEAQLRVEDQGVGVPADEQDRIFEPYYRSTRTRSVSGTGLGLHISRLLAERHGGRLWLERSSEAGSVFAFALPSLDR